ncbi:MAG: hypothetical protein ABF306_13955 [Nocardioides marinisabuli]|uniref:hypothetical protein n=1 Tax=Nocardioides marinisabuli TaxID=419476 RepID=UPI003219BF82
MSVELRWSTADDITAGLERARTSIEECASSVPSGIDGGDVTALLLEMVAHLLEAAAEVSEGLLGASDNVRSAVAVLQSADRVSHETFTSGWW